MRTFSRMVLTTAALFVLVGLVAPAQAQAIKIGVFDAARVSEEAAGAQQLQADLLSMREQKQADIAAKEQTINDLRQRLQQQALSLSADKRTTMELDIQRRLLELNSMKDIAGQELQLEFAAAEARFNDKLRAAVEQFGRDQGFALILDVNAVAWASTAIDVTAPIVDQYNRMFPGTAPEGGSE